MSDLLDAVLDVLDTQIRPLLAVHGGGVDLVEVTPAGEVRLVYEGACRGCSLKSVTYVLGIRQKLMPIPGVTEVTVEGVRLSRASLERAARMYAGYSPWVGAPATAGKSQVSKSVGLFTPCDANAWPAPELRDGP